MENIKRLKFLVVDDDPSVRISHGAIIEDHYPKCQIDYGKDGEELIKCTSEDKYDMVITDNDLPKKTGLEAFLELRKSGNLTPVIMVTGKITDELKKYEENPANKFTLLEKPVDIDKLQSGVNKFLNEQGYFILPR